MSSSRAVGFELFARFIFQKFSVTNILRVPNTKGHTGIRETFNQREKRKSLSHHQVTIADASPVPSTSSAAKVSNPVSKKRKVKRQNIPLSEAREMLFIDCDSDSPNEEEIADEFVEREREREIVMELDEAEVIDDPVIQTTRESEPLLQLLVFQLLLVLFIVHVILLVKVMRVILIHHKSVIVTL